MVGRRASLQGPASASNYLERSMGAVAKSGSVRAGRHCCSACVRSSPRRRRADNTHAVTVKFAALMEQYSPSGNTASGVSTLCIHAQANRQLHAPLRRAISTSPRGTRRRRRPEIWMRQPSGTHHARTTPCGNDFVQLAPSRGTLSVTSRRSQTTRCGKREAAKRRSLIAGFLL